jgi:hypothetical protein
MRQFKGAAAWANKAIFTTWHDSHGVQPEVARVCQVMEKCMRGALAIGTHPQRH